MTLEELGQKLREMYENAEKGKDKDYSIYLFGIMYAEDINALGRNAISEIIKKSGIAKDKKSNYGTMQINAGKSLAQYVKVKDDEVKKFFN